MIGFIGSIQGNTVGLLCTHAETRGISWPAQQTSSSQCLLTQAVKKREGKRHVRTNTVHEYPNRNQRRYTWQLVPSYSWAPTGAYDQLAVCWYIMTHRLGALSVTAFMIRALVGGGGRPLLHTPRVLPLLHTRNGYYITLGLGISTKMKSTVNIRGNSNVPNSL
jgi:hypothetical protein